MEVNFSDLFFTCSLIELIGRTAKQKRDMVVDFLGKKVVKHIYEHADVLHCEPIAKHVDVFIEMCHVPMGDFDNVGACKYNVPSYWDIGKVYARLIEDFAGDDVIEALFEVYHSSVCDAISNYNSDFFYQSRGYIKAYHLNDKDPNKVSQWDFE